MPSVGCPAKGISIFGVKMRIRACAFALGLVDEDGLGQVHLPRDLLQLLLGDLARVCEDSDLVALQRGVGEDVGDDVAEASHAAILA